ncbi:MAG: PAS domain-containing protein [Rhodospirillales bacterium]|nr:PAS domain-containing protein [Rhodospirillales bacterium]
MANNSAKPFHLESVTRQILDASPDSVAVMDHSFHYVYVNRVFLARYDQSLENVIGKTPEIVVGKSLFDDTVKSRMLACLNGEVVDYEAEFDIPGLGLRWLRLRYAPLYDDAGSVSAILSQTRDITREKEEEQVRETLERERLFIRQVEEVMQVGVFIWDVETQRNVYTSDSLGHIHGMTPEEMAATVDGEEADVNLAIPEDRKRLAEAYENSRLYGTPLNVEYRIDHPTNGRRWINEVAVRRTLGVGKRIVTMGLIHDVTERKRNEENLEIQRMVSEQAEKIGKIGYWMWDMIEDRSLYFSDQAAAIHGVSREAFAEMQTSGENDLQRIHPDDYDRMHAAVYHAKQTGGVLDEEYRINHTDGGIRWVQEITMPHRVVDGKVTVLIGTLQDITERRQKEEELRQRDIVYRQIEETISIGYWTFDEEDYGVSYCSEGVARIYDLTVEEYREQFSTMEGELATVHEEDRDMVEKALLQFQQTAETYDSEFRIVLRDGTVRWVHEVSAPLRVSAEGTLEASIGTLRDITARKLEEEDLRQREVMFKQIDQNFDIGFWTWEAEPYGMSYVSEAYCRIFGRPANEILAQSSSLENELAIIHPDDQARMRETFLILNQKSIPYDEEYRIIRPDGEIRWVHEVTAPMRQNDDGSLASDIGVMHDITEQRVREEELEIAKEAAEHASLAKSDFLAHMSHELRTPLNAVLGFSDAMRSEIFGPVGDDRYREYLDNIQSSGRLLLALINDLLDMAAIEAGELSIDLEPQNIGALVTEMLELAGPMARAKTIAVTGDGDLAGLNLMVDPRRFRQIILNLVINAVKYTPADGAVFVFSGVDDQGRPTVSVRDNGIGMTEDEVEAALIPFKQIKNANIRQIEGTGIGLPLTNQLVELHRGEMTIMSTKGKGTTVMICLPIERIVH